MTNGVGPFFTLVHEWWNLCRALYNIAEYKTYKILFLVVSVVSGKMIFVSSISHYKSGK